MNADIHAAIYRWDQARKALERAAAEENEARLALCAIGFNNPVEGVNNEPLSNGWTLVGTFRNNYNLDNKSVEEALKKLPKPIANGLVTWNAKLKVGAYKALEPAHKLVLNEVLTIKPGMPQLELIPPKEG